MKEWKLQNNPPVNEEPQVTYTPDLLGGHNAIPEMSEAGQLPPDILGGLLTCNSSSSTAV